MIGERRVDRVNHIIFTKKDKTLVTSSVKGLLQGDPLSTQLFCLSLINVNNNLVEKWRNVSQYYYADNANAVGNFRDLLDWAKKYITMIEATGYELGTKQSYSPYEIPEDIKIELRLLNIEILNDRMEETGLI